MRNGGLAAWLGLALAWAGSVQGEEGVMVMIDGEPGTTFTADWRFVEASNARALRGRWSGQVPQVHDLPTGALDMVLTQTSASGRLEVTVSAGSNRSYSATQGQGSQIRLLVQ